MVRKIIIIKDQAINQCFIGLNLSRQYEVNYVDSWGKAKELMKNQAPDGLIFNLPGSGFTDLADIPARVCLFCVVSPSKELPFIPSDTPPIHLIPLPFNSLELQTAMRRAFSTDLPPPKITAPLVSESKMGEVKAEKKSNLVLMPAKIKQVVSLPFSLIHNTVLDLVHTVKNPLVSIQTFAQMLPEKIDDLDFRTSFSRFVTSEINVINNRLNNYLEKVSLPESSPEDFEVGDFLELIKEQLGANYPELRIVFEPGLRYDLKGNCQKLCEAAGLIWSIILEVVNEPLSLTVNYAAATCGADAEVRAQSLLELYFTLKFQPQYIDMELDFLSTAQRPKGVEILYALRLIENMGGSLKITKAEENAFIVKISLPGSLVTEEAPVKVAGIEEYK